MQPYTMGNRIVLSVFLLHFLVYAISPLSLFGPANAAGEQRYIGQDKPVFIKHVEVFFLNMFLSNFNDREDADDSTSRLILIKKIKAVVQSLTDAKSKLARISVHADNHLAYEIFPSGTIAVRAGTPKPYENFLSVFSGLSPPSV